jgi:hypothetical protein
MGAARHGWRSFVKRLEPDEDAAAASPPLSVAGKAGDVTLRLQSQI